MFLLSSTKLIVVIAIFVITVNGEFPQDPKACRYGDVDCIKNLINYYATKEYKGDQSINLIPIDPLQINDISLENVGTSPIKLNYVKFSNNLMYGLNTAKVKQVKGFNKDLKQTHQIVVNFDYLSIRGDYDVNGKFFFFSLKGHDKSNFTMHNVDMVLEFNGASYEKDGLTYMKVDKMQLKADPKGMTIDFKNLANGKYTKLLNSNWKLLYAEISVELNKAFAKVYTEIINHVFAKYPYNKYFNE